jgi:hypothetical protein
MSVLIECPSCKRRLAPPEGEWDRRMMCSSCGSTFVVDVSGNPMLPPITAISSGEAAPRPMHVRPTLPIPEDDPYEISAKYDADPVLLQKIFDPRSIHRFSRPFKIGLFLTLFLGVLRILSSSFRSRKDISQVIFESVMTSILAGLLTGFVFSLMFMSMSEKRRTRWADFLPYPTVALVWLFVWLLYPSAAHPITLDNFFDSAQLTLLFATIASWVLFIPTQIIFHWSGGKCSTGPISPSAATEREPGTTETSDSRERQTRDERVSDGSPEIDIRPEMK